MSDVVESFLSQSPGCFWIVQAGPGAERLSFERVWGRTIPLFGTASDRLAGRLCAEVLPARTAASWEERFSRAIRGETLLLRERRDQATWFVSLFPLRLDRGGMRAGGVASELTLWKMAEQQLRHTVLGALKAQEFERTMMSRFLHDSVGQNLTALGLQLDLIRMDLESIAPEVGSRVTEIQKSLSEMMEAVREYSYELNPSTVERAGLRAALDRLAVRTRDRFSGALRVNVDPSIKLGSILANAIYHIAQEAVENAVQHSGCTSIDLVVKTVRGGAMLEVRDNGRGFDPEDIQGGHRGLGLLSMEHYAAQAGLELSIVSTRDAGTAVRAFRE